MANNTYKITLSDNTVLDNLVLNGSCFMSETELTKDMFEDKLSKVIIEGTDEEGNEVYEEHTNMELLGISIHKGIYYLAIGDIPESVLEKIKIQSDIEYIAMMTDVDLEEE